MSPPTLPPAPGADDPECAWLCSRICAYKSLRSSEGACCPMCRAPVDADRRAGLVGSIPLVREAADAIVAGEVSNTVYQVR